MNWSTYGLILIVVGVMDAILSFVLPRRIPDPRQQRIMGLALRTSGVLFIVGGAVLWARARP